MPPSAATVARVLVPVIAWSLSVGELDRELESAPGLAERLDLAAGAVVAAAAAGDRLQGFAGAEGVEAGADELAAREGDRVAADGAGALADGGDRTVVVEASDHVAVQVEDVAGDRLPVERAEAVLAEVEGGGGELVLDVDESPARMAGCAGELGRAGDDRGEG